MRSMFGRIALQVGEGTVVPALIFWAVFHLSGLDWALVAGLGWCYLALARRWFRGMALPTALVVGAALFTTRTGVALAFHSTFLYLLTPTINAFLLAGAFVVSAVVRRPLTARFARDFIGLPASVVALARVQRALRGLCAVWALVNVVSGGIALQLLVADHVDGVLLARSVLGPVLTSVAVGCCLVVGRRALRAEGVVLHVRWRDAGVS